MEAIILAGGFGTHPAHLAADVPKPMAPVAGRPFLRYLLDHLQKSGVERVILAVGNQQEGIRNFFGGSYRGMELVYSFEDMPLGTGGALRKALRLCREERVFVVSGDTYFDVKLQEMRKVSSPLVVAVKKLQNVSLYGTVAVQDGRITGFAEKQPCTEGLVNGGVYLLSRQLLENMPEQFSFEKDVLEAKIWEIPMMTFESAGSFLTIGIPEDNAAAQETLKRLAPANKAAFFDRDGTINVDVRYLHQPEDLKFMDGMPEFIRKWNDWGYWVIVVTNQAGIARGYYTEAEMHALHRYMNEKLSKYGAHIDAFYFCPHHPDVTGPCHCRKPEPGMIEQAIREFDLDPAQCILFGDQPWDLKAGEACGIKGYYAGTTAKDTAD